MRKIVALVLSVVVGTLQAANQEISGTPMANFNNANILIGYHGKKKIGCPEQSSKTAIILATGQSNAGNYAGQRYESQHGNAVVNYFAGNCYLAASPLLGSGGLGGEPWTPLANRLIESKVFEQVIIIAAGYAGEGIESWLPSPSNRAYNALSNTLDELSFSNKYKITHILWVQGETDYMRNTPEASYRMKFGDVLGYLRKHTDAPVFVALSTKCYQGTNYNRDNPVSRALKSLTTTYGGVHPGPNTDELLLDIDRQDDCHLGWSGVEKVATEWAQVLSRYESIKNRR